MALVDCAQCGKQTDTNGRGVGVLVQAIAVNRKQGGWNHFVRPVALGQYFCFNCRVSHEPEPEQMELGT